MRNFTKAVAILSFLFLISDIPGQTSRWISETRITPAAEGIPVTLEAGLQQSAGINNIILHYRSFEDPEYTPIEMLIDGLAVRAEIPGDDVKPPYIEYYIEIQPVTGGTELYPPEMEASGTPGRILVKAPSEKDSEALVLSPVDNEAVSAEDLFISVSFLKATDKVDPLKTKLFINGSDVTEYAVITDDLLLLYPDNTDIVIPPGLFAMKIELYDNSGKPYHSIERGYNVIEFQQWAGRAEFKYNAEVRGETRNEQYGGTGTWYNNIAISGRGEYKDIKFNGRLLATSEEKSYLQPQNRYSLNVYNSWFNLALGDNFPRFPSLVMNGKRLRGVSGQLNFGVFNLHSSYGQTRRGIEGRVLQTYTDETIPFGASNIIAVDEAKYLNPYASISPGTYSRDLFIVRPSFGSGKNFQFGLSYMHAKDDVSSIEFGMQPKENVVVGTDLKLAFDDGNIRMYSQAAMSLYNSDISSGTFTDEQIDNLLDADDPNSDSALDMDPEDAKKYRDYLSDFITVNQYIGPLNPEELSSFAGESKLTLNYFNNNLNVAYIYRGNEYTSYGATFIQTDKKGFQVSDRIRLLDNKVFITGSFENLTDNLQETKVTTTTYRRIKTSVSYFPRNELPNITVGYNNYTNKSDLGVNDPAYASYVYDDITQRYFMQMSYDFTAGIDHKTTLAFSSTDREDNSVRNTDSKNFRTSAGITSTWSKMFTSSFQVIYYNSEVPQYDVTRAAYVVTPYNYFSFNIGGRTRLLDEKLRISGGIMPSFGDYERLSFDAQAAYQIIPQLDLILRAAYYNNPGGFNNSIVGLVTRYNI